MKKFLSLGILAGLIFTGLSFGQDEAPPIQFLGVGWVPHQIEIVKSFDDLDVELIYLYAADKVRRNGTIQLLLIVTKDRSKYAIIAAWFSPYKLKDLYGTVIKDDGTPLFTKTFAEGEMLIWKDDEDQDGNTVLKFTWLKRNYDGVTKTDNPTAEVVRTMDLKKFIEENLK